MVVAIHYRLKDGSWLYYPTGVKKRLPWVIGGVNADGPNHSFESTWDGLDFMDRSELRRHHNTRRGQWQPLLPVCHRPARSFLSGRKTI